MFWDHCYCKLSSRVIVNLLKTDISKDHPYDTKNSALYDDQIIYFCIIRLYQLHYSILFIMQSLVQIPKLRISWCLKFSVLLGLSVYMTFIVYHGPLCSLLRNSTVIRKNELNTEGIVTIVIMFQHFIISLEITEKYLHFRF